MTEIPEFTENEKAQMSPRLLAMKPFLILLGNALRSLNIFPSVVVGRRENTRYIQKILDQFYAEREKDMDKQFLEMFKTLRDFILLFCDEDDGYADLFLRFCEIIKDSNPPKSRSSWH